MKNQINRRQFLVLSACSAGVAFLDPSELFAMAKRSSGNVRFAVSSDVHVRYRYEDYGCPSTGMSSPEKRWADFFKAAEKWNADVVMDLGDLQPRTFETGPGKEALDVWNSWPKEKIAVYGNHDNDFMPKEEYLAAMGMPSPYYAKEIKNWTFIVLDTGELKQPADKKDKEWGFGAEGYDWGMEQMPWLKEQIEKASGYCVILSHFCVRHGDSPLPTEPFRKLLKEANDKAGYKKLVACFYGHRHVPSVDVVDGVSFIGINSMNYRHIPPHNFLFYKDPAPWATGMFTKDGKIYLAGTGRPNNWATGCQKNQVSPPDDLTYQTGIPVKSV